jgi:hypothetical protein
MGDPKGLMVSDSRFFYKRAALALFLAAENDIVKYYDTAPSLTLVVLVN